MTRIFSERMTAELEGEIVVFLIGMRVNRWWKIHKWVPMVWAMFRMSNELAARPESGFICGHRWAGNPTIVVQYWRSFEQLERYARNRDETHWPAWSAYNRAVSKNGDVGVWHETYRVRPGDYECVYVNMPLFGLGRATKLVPAAGYKATAAGRMRQKSGQQSNNS